MDALGADFTLFCPAFPENGRTIYRGYLFVGDVLLSESGMRDHPLTPMRDPSLVRVLQRQTPRQGRAGTARDRRAGRRRRSAPPSTRCGRQGFRHAIVDAIEDHDLEAIGEAAADFPLITGGSGIALGLPENFRRQGLLGDGGAADALPPVAGAAAVLSGSCSRSDARPGRLYARARAGVHDRPDRGGCGPQHRRGGARLGDAAARRSAGPDRATAPPEEVAAVQQAARPRARRRAGRGDAGRDRPRARRTRRAAASSSPAARPPGRSSRRSASPGCASAGRSTPACRGP